MVASIDNRMLTSRHHTQDPLHRKRILQQTGSYLVEEYATSQLHCSLREEVNKFLLVYVILFKGVYFWQCFAYFHKRIYLIAATF